MPRREAESAGISRTETPSAPAPALGDAGPKPPVIYGAPTAKPIVSASVRQLIEENKLDPGRLAGTGPGGRITKNDVRLYLEQRNKVSPEENSKAPAAAAVTGAKAMGKPAEDEEITRKPMSPIRRRIAERLLEARRNTAMLTTFNDADMSQVLDLRSRYKAKFQEQHGVSLGLMSFFVKATVEALKEMPEINAFIDGQDIVYHHYYHIGVAVGSGRGLVVPVIRHADRLSFGEIEKTIVALVAKINDGKLELADLEGGTFTITNGGVFGSLLSTPILNTPQSGILGMHRIEKRPVAVDDQVIIRPMMYMALSYDHRLVDGREAVTFLKRIKECVENPERIMMEI